MKKTAAFFTLVILIFGIASCSQKREYTRGILTSTTFESEYLNLKFTAPEGTTMATEEEMKKVSSMGAQVAQVDSQQFDAALENTVYEMQAFYIAGYPNVFLIVEKLAFSNMTVENYMESVKQQLSKLSTVKYDITTEDEKATIAGQKYSKLSASAIYGTVSLTQDYYVRIQDGRAISFIVTYTSDTIDKKNELLEAFKEYN